MYREKRKTNTRLSKRVFVHFLLEKNVIYERAVFNRQQQGPNESVDSFVTVLYALAEHCNYGNLKEKLIRDRLVVGLTDSRLSERV